jgi:hypothetical protein
VVGLPVPQSTPGSMISVFTSGFTYGSLGMLLPPQLFLAANSLVLAGYAPGLRPSKNRLKTNVIGTPRAVRS